jgi:hydroxymethylbilane synthase
MKLRIATRTSDLALWQARYVQQQLLLQDPNLTVELVPLKTQGDKILAVSLAKIGGKGLFIKELENALLAQQADLAVHSLKDMPVKLAAEFELMSIGPREDPRDCLISYSHKTLAQLAPGAIIGTSSLRRQLQVQRLRPDCKIDFLRGNVLTRLKKLQAGQYDAIILATAGVKRLALEAHISEYLAVDTFVPAVGQGTLAVQWLTQRQDLSALLAPLVQYKTEICQQAERAMNLALGGSCQVPVAGYAKLSQGQLTLVGRVGDPKTGLLLEAILSAPAAQAREMGQAVAKQLIAQGAQSILAQYQDA